MRSLIQFFIKRHILVNLITVGVLFAGIVFWNMTSKEELPDVTFNTVRISTAYSGASARDVEFYVTEPIEEVLHSLDGVYRITSSSAGGRSNISVELDKDVSDIDKAVTDIQRQIDTVQLPEDIINPPQVRVFETSKKAIIDIALYDENSPILDVTARQRLQEISRGLENRLVSEPEIFEVRKSGYLAEEVTIQVKPEKMLEYEIPLTELAQSIQRNHIRAPAGTLKSGRNQQVTLLNELNDKQSLDKLIVQGSFDSVSIPLSEMATIKDGFEDQTTIYKVNGREAIIFNVVKNSRYGILETLEKVRLITDTFNNTVLKNTQTLSNSTSSSTSSLNASVTLRYLDDESIDIQNRLSIVTQNGLIGFLLISIILLIFLNKRSGFWVALGIPFTLCFTLVGGYLLNFTINGITLASIIIVLGIVVDDAIIVAENIFRKFNEGMNLDDAAVEGTLEVAPPIIASIITTCVAFLPLFFFSGRFGDFVSYIPPVIFLMLGASLIESFFLLPAHLLLAPKDKLTRNQKSRVWFTKWENVYEKLLIKLLPKRYVILALFIGLMALSVSIVKSEFKFVLFPNQESREIVLSGIASTATTSKETAQSIQPIEEFMRKYLGKEGVAIRSVIARGRRGNAAMENQFQITLEIIPADERERSIDDLIKEIKTYVKTQDTITKLRFRKRRYGQQSGSVFEIVVAENDDSKRETLLNAVLNALNRDPNITNVEEDIIPTKKEYEISIDQQQLKQLSVNPKIISSTLRSILNGQRLYTVYRNDEEVQFYLSVDDNYRKTIDQALSIPIANNQKYMIPLRDLVNVNEINKKSVIRRQYMKRSSFIDADLSDESTLSPLELARYYETRIFPKLLANYPSSQLYFQGEVVDTRESKRDLRNGIMLVLALIYLVLAILFDSIIKPLRIMLVIPFGIIGVILAFYLHGKTQFGFYAAIGSLGMLGVVVNDAIVMLSKLDKGRSTFRDPIRFTASIAKTRLRAIILTTLTTVAGVMPTAYGFGGTDVMLSDMMLALAYGLLFGTAVTLILTPCFFLFEFEWRRPLKLLFYSKKVSVILLILGTLSGPTLFANNKTENHILDTHILSYKNVIDLTVKNDINFHAILMEKLSLTHTLAANVSPPELLIDLTSGLTLSGGESNDSHNLSISQSLPNLGQVYKASLINGSSSTSSDSYSISLSQDIARNAFGTSHKLDKKIQTIKNEITAFQIIEAYEDYMASLATLYYSWIRQFESYTLALSSLKENQKVLDSIKRRRAKKIADDTDVNKLELQLIAKEETVIRYKRDYDAISRDIARVTGLNSSTEDAMIKPDTRITLDTIPNSFDASMATFSNSRSAKILTLLEDESDITTKRLARELLPSIQLSAQYTQSNGTGSSTSQTDENSTALSTTIGLPLFNNQAKAKHRIAKINAKKQRLESDAAKDTLLIDIENLYYSLETQFELVQTAERKRQLAANILKNESSNYALGKINLNDYIQAVNRFDSSRFDEINQKISFQQLSIEWKRLTDSLIINL